MKAEEIKILPKAILLTILNSYKRNEPMETQIALIKVGLESYHQHQLKDELPSDDEIQNEYFKGNVVDRFIDGAIWIKKLLNNPHNAE